MKKFFIYFSLAIVNAVTAIVFDFRGYDTLGESFILLTAISGSIIIFKSEKNRGQNSDEEKYKG